MNLALNKLPLFKLEDFLSKHEFTAKHLLCCSDAETLSMQELLNYADTGLRDSFDNLPLSYTEVSGNPELRADIAGLYEGLDASNILCFAGAEEGIFVTFSSLLNKGDHVIVFTPCYQSLQAIPEALGCDVTSIALREENAWQIDFDELKSKLRNNTKLVIINTPHNPTGQMLDQCALDSLVDMLRDNGTYLFADEVYFHLGPTTTSWPKQVAEMYERGISLNVMSKAYGLAGLRIGWIAAHDKDLLKKCEQMKHYTTICNSAPSEVLSRIAIKVRDKIIGRNNRIIDANMGLFDAFMKRHSHLFSWIRPQGGCTGFVKYLGKETTDDFVQRLVSEKGVLLLSSSQYDFGHKHFRIGFGRSKFFEGLWVLEHTLKNIF